MFCIIVAPVSLRSTTIRNGAVETFLFIRYALSMVTEAKISENSLSASSSSWDMCSNLSSSCSSEEIKWSVLNTLAILLLVILRSLWTQHGYTEKPMNTTWLHWEAYEHNMVTLRSLWTQHGYTEKHMNPAWLHWKAYEHNLVTFSFHKDFIRIAWFYLL